MSNLLKETLNSIKPLDREMMTSAQERLDFLLKPPGSLGKLEDLARQLAGIYGVPRPAVGKKAIIMMAADNGVYDQGYSSFPQEITRAVAELSAPGLVGVAVLARHAGARLVVVDVGIKDDGAGKGIIVRKVRNSTGNIAKEAAMTREEAIKTIEIGIEITNQLIDDGIEVIGTGEAGICNTTTSAAVIASLTGKDAEDIVGRGAGVDEKTYQMKIKAVQDALAVNSPDPTDPIDVIAKVGGLDIAGMVGCFLAGAARRKPVVIDGFISGAAALAAISLNPLAKEYMIPSHYSAEQGTHILLQALGLEPMLLMNMRLGEGTGAALAFNLIDASCRIINEMGTFGDLG